MNQPTRTPQPSRESGDAQAARARRRPLATFLLLTFALGWPALAAPVVTGLPTEPFLLFFLYGALLAPALLVTRWADGPGSVRALLSRVLMWRFGLGRWAVILFGVPLLTLVLAALTGTLEHPAGGWLPALGWYLLNTLVVGALIANLWEETAWGGFVQSRLTARHGLLVGALLTAPLFAAMHVPLHFEAGWTWPEVAGGLALLFALAPVYRYLLGMHLVDTGGSILALGVQHAAWNAAQKLDAVRGEWQPIAAVVLLTVLLAADRRLRHRRPDAPESEQATAEPVGRPQRQPSSGAT